MAISTRRLGEDEYVVAYTRTHWKALVLPVIALLSTCALAGFLLAGVSSRRGYEALKWLVVAGAALAILWFAVRPFLRWLTASYTLTNRRLISRSGIFTRSGRDIPLQRVTDVRYERGLLDRMLGCGTLVISDASEGGRSVLPDVPRVAALHSAITDLLLDGQYR
jgi:uncharacterized membrane protein YdbT with pleckstrin-like domain